MDRREMLGLLGAGTIGMTALGARAQAQDHDHDHDHGHGGADEEHLHTIGHCAVVCNETAHHCLEMICEQKGDLKQHAKIHELTMDCQAFCVLSVALMARSSDLAHHAHAACAEACAACAKACEEAGGSDEQHKTCGEACRACEKVCREMVQGHHGH